MICIPRPTFDPLADAPLNHRVVVVTHWLSEWPPYIEGLLVGVTWLDERVEWLIRDDDGNRWSVPWGEVRDWEVDDVRLDTPGACRDGRG